MNFNLRLRYTTNQDRIQKNLSFFPKFQEMIEYRQPPTKSIVFGNDRRSLAFQSTATDHGSDVCFSGICKELIMKRIFISKSLFALIAFMFLAGSVDVLAQRKPTIKRKPVASRTARSSVPQYAVETGTVIHVRMNRTISSKTAKVGDTFSVTSTEPVYSNNGVVVIPTGSTITGRISSAKAADKGGDPGTIDVRFVEVRLPNGVKRTINGSLAELDEKNATSDNEGTASGGKMKNRKIIFIGGGGAGGAVLGAAIGGGKGALIGGIIGAAGGFLGDRLLRGSEAEVKSGTEFGVRLDQAISLPRFAEAVQDTPIRTETPMTGNDRTYIVQPGDTLSKISIKFYGTSRRYMDIYDANRDTLSSPANIAVGQELIIP